MADVLSTIAYFPGLPVEPVPELLTEAEAVRYCRLDQTGVKDPGLTLRRYRRRGLLRGTQVGKKVFYLREELNAFLRNQTEVNPR